MKFTQLLRFAAKSGSSNKPDPTRDWRWQISGMDAKGMKKHYSIIPMYGFTIVAMALAGTYVLRLATKHPEVSWTKKTAEPWNEYKNKQYKFVDSGRDYSNSSPAPPFK